MTVSSLTMTKADRQSDRQSVQAPDNHAQKTRSATVKLQSFLGEAPEHTDLVSKRQDLQLESGLRRKTENIVERNRHSTLNIGLASPFRTRQT
jgi:hypothetical protein